MTAGEDQAPVAVGVVPGLALPEERGVLADILAGLPPPGVAIRTETERLNRLALASVSAKEYAAALPLLQRALSLDPDSAVAPYNLRRTFPRAKPKAEAAGHYPKRNALNPQ